MIFPKRIFLQEICSFSVSKDAQLVRFMCCISGLGEAQQVFLKSDLKNQIQKIASWYQLALLAAVANSKVFVQKNNRPLQVELENGRSDLQNDFRI